MKKTEGKQVTTRLDPATHANLMSLQANIYRILQDRVSLSETLRLCINFIYEKSSKDNNIDFLLESSDKSKNSSKE